MSNESIELYKPWEPNKATLPMAVSRKLDGVPVRIRRMGGNHVFAYSRQNEVITSIPHILPYAGRFLLDSGSLVGELYIEGMPFKDISGLVRQKKPSLETAKLKLHVFDADIRNKPERPYSMRISDVEIVLKALAGATGKALSDLPIELIPFIICHDAASVQRAFELVMQANPNAEGVVAHNLAKPFQPGTRRWDTMKLKPEPTIDVLVNGFTEAVDKYKNPMDMVGNLTFDLHSITSKGVITITPSASGPGALKHAERKVLWAQFKQGKFRPRIAEIRYMKDDTYDGLRQPTFVRWRDDKVEPDVRHK